MNEKTLKTKITRILKSNNIPKSVIKNHKVLNSGFYYSTNEIRWINFGHTTPEYYEEKIKKILHCLEQNGLAEFVELTHVGLANIPVVKLKAE